MDFKDFLENIVVEATTGRLLWLVAAMWSLWQGKSKVIAGFRQGIRTLALVTMRAKKAGAQFWVSCNELPVWGKAIIFGWFGCYSASFGMEMAGLGAPFILEFVTVMVPFSLAGWVVCLKMIQAFKLLAKNRIP